MSEDQISKDEQSDQTKRRAAEGAPPKRGAAIRLIVMLVIVVAIGGYLLDRRLKPHLTVGPMVQLVSANALTVVWETEPRSSGKLIVQVGGESPDSQVSQISIDATYRGRHYVAELTELPPRTQVSYRIEHHGFLGRRFVLAEATTRTAPKQNAPVRFLAFGDSGGDTVAQHQLAARMPPLDPDLVIHTGDLVYLIGAQQDYADTFYRPYAELIRSVPFYPSLGNHDVKSKNGRPLLDNFELPTNGPPDLEPERCYAFEYGDALFIGLDSTFDGDTLAGQVAPWTETQLKNSSASWKFVFFHHPPYSGGRKHGSNLRVRKALVPALERGGADVVFCGHEHHYERTAPLLQDKVVDQGGVVYVVTGAGGMSRYLMREDPPDYIVAHNDQKYSFTLVDINGDSLNGKQIDEAGETLDEWHMTKEH